MSQPEVSMLVYREVLEKFDPQLRNALTQFMGSFLFIAFCKANQEIADKNIRELQPNGRMTPDEYFQLSKDMRLVWRFWTDLLLFAEEYKQQ